MVQHGDVMVLATLSRGWGNPWGVRGGVRDGRAGAIRARAVRPLRAGGDCLLRCLRVQQDPAGGRSSPAREAPRCGVEGSLAMLSQRDRAATRGAAEPSCKKNRICLVVFGFRMWF